MHGAPDYNRIRIAFRIAGLAGFRNPTTATRRLNSQLRGVVIMFDQTTSEQFGPTLAPSKQQNGSFSRPIRFQSASEEQILSFFLKFTIEELIAHFDSAGALP